MHEEFFLLSIKMWILSFQSSECCSSPLYCFLDLYSEHLQISDNPMSEEGAFFLRKIQRIKQEVCGTVSQSCESWKYLRLWLFCSKRRNNGSLGRLGGWEGRSQSIFCDWVLMTIIRRSMSLQWMPDLLPTWEPTQVCSEKTNFKYWILKYFGFVSKIASFK